MRWKIEEFTFSERQQTLSEGGNTQQLEPLVVDLLAYLCRHPNETISRDQLVEHVWAGRIITDNAVTKVITKLRKYFNDDAKKPKFIATYPKKGYRFIATISALAENPDSGETPTAVDDLALKGDYRARVKPVRSVLWALAIGILLFLLHKFFMPGTTLQNFSQVKAVTRDPGRESRPQVSPDEKYLAYIEVRDSKMRLWVKSLIDESAVEINHGDETDTWVDSGSWNSDGSHIAYLVTTPNTCQYFIRDFNHLELGEPKLIHNCPAGSYGKIAFTHDDNRLVYSEAAKRGTPFELFELNLATGKKRRLNQPKLFLGGNSQFDLHPKLNRLLISSPDEQQWEGFYSLDLETDELELLFKQDAFICCGRWDHSGERVVLMGEHPATQLVSFDLTGKDKQVLYSGSGQIRVPERHKNGKDYLFPIVHLNQNVNLYQFENQKTEAIVVSSVDDRLATFAHHAKILAYIGLSSGKEEIWLTNYEGSWKKKLTNLAAANHYIELGWSPLGTHIFGLTLNEIHIIDTQTGINKTLKIPQVEIRSVSWKDNKTIAYSINTSDGWLVHYYDTQTDKVMPDPQKWQYIRFSPNRADTLWVDHNNQLFFGEDKQPVDDAELLQAVKVTGRFFNLKKSGENWVWNRFDLGRYQLMLKTGFNAKPRSILDNDSYYFDLSEYGILFHASENIGADIYQTVSD